MHDAEQYLLEWKNNNNTWKFQKSKQNWIIRNLYTMEKTLFKIAIKYLKAGSVKPFLIEAAKVIMEKETLEETNPEYKRQKRDKKRARKILKISKTL